jgi:hypothetical protein
MCMVGLAGSAGADSNTGGAGEAGKVERCNSKVGNVNVNMKDKQLVEGRKQKSKKLYIFRE